MFLADLEPRPLQLPDGTPRGWEPVGLWVAEGDNRLQVITVMTPGRPTRGALRRLWDSRDRNRALPMALVALWQDPPGRATMMIRAPGGPLVVEGLPAGVTERLCRAALAKPDTHTALRFLLDSTPEADSGPVGVRTSGLLAAHELAVGVPARGDWADASRQGRGLLGLAGSRLIDALGYRSQPSGAGAVLLDGDDRRAVAVLLTEDESFDEPTSRLSDSPVAYGLALADRENLPWVLLVRGHQLRLYATAADIGVGAKGRAATYVEADTVLLDDDHAGYLPLLFGPRALRPEGTLEEILAESRRFAAALAMRLRERVYHRAVPQLAQALAHHTGTDDLDALYRRVMVLLFRLLFIAYAEDRDLLPWRANDLYRAHSLKQLAIELTARIRDNTPYDPAATTMWHQVADLFDAVRRGRADWQVPPYDGNLFTTDPDVNPDAAALDGLSLTDADIGPALAALLVDEGPDGTIGPVDFRALSVREFGTIYEGLLESQLICPPDDPTGTVVVQHRSGERKSTGSYFTKPFVVELLLTDTLDPALADHLKKVERLRSAGDEAGASRLLFRFRVADIAMGSGHFLVAAVDHIEAAYTRYLTEHPISTVRAELDRLRDAARASLRELADTTSIDDTQLLRRLIARRCIYGVDRNPIATELARLAIWIHTFVPGLPLSYLDHNLICGDSLTGIHSITEARTLASPPNKGARPKPDTGGQIDLVEQQLATAVAEAAPILERLAALAETTPADITQARELHQTARHQTRGMQDVLDLLVAHHGGLIDHDLLTICDPDTATRLAADHRDLIGQLAPVHFPLAFPEVFHTPDNTNEPPAVGFDVIVGNPPWDEVTVERLGFWAIRFPELNLKSLTSRQQTRTVTRLARDHPELEADYQRAVAEAETLRAVLTDVRYPGMSTGDPDLYLAFAWRFWMLAASGGRIGVVLPRSILNSAGGTRWRNTVFHQADVAAVTLENSRGWVFDDVEVRYTIALVEITRTPKPLGLLQLWGPFRSRSELTAGRHGAPATLPVEGLERWTGGRLTLPLLPGHAAGGVLQSLRSHPDLTSPGRDWYAWPADELHATNDKHLFDPDPHANHPGWWPVYKGASFNLWEPDTGTYYGWIDPGAARDHLTAKERGRQLRDLPENLQPPSCLPSDRPRIAYRDVTNRTNTRTVIAALVPPGVVLTNKAPYLVFARGHDHPAAQAYLLGVMCSVPFDWYARRFVETAVTKYLLKSFPVPSAGPDDPLRTRTAEIAGTLAAVDDRYGDWATQVGVPVGGVGDPERKQDLISELDAVVALLYGLTEDQLRVVFETFHHNPANSPVVRLDQVVDHYRAWRGRV